MPWILLDGNMFKRAAFKKRGLKFAFRRIIRYGKRATESMTKLDGEAALRDIVRQELRNLFLETKFGETHLPPPRFVQKRFQTTSRGEERSLDTTVLTQAVSVEMVLRVF